MWSYFKNKVAGMNIWDIAMLKLYVISIGLIVGAYFPEIVKQYLWVLVAIIVVTLVFLMYGLFFRSNNQKK